MIPDTQILPDAQARQQVLRSLSETKEMVAYDIHLQTQLSVEVITKLCNELVESGDAECVPATDSGNVMPRFRRISNAWSMPGDTSNPERIHMASATKEPKQKKQFTENVTFTGLSIGDTTCRLGCKLGRERLDISDAAYIFAGSRCNAKITIKADGEQQSIQVAGKSIKEIPPIEAVVDIKRFGTSADTYSFGLTLQMTEIDISTLVKYANHEGRLTLKRTGDIPDAVKAEADKIADDAGEDPDDMPGDE